MNKLKTHTLQLTIGFILSLMFAPLSIADEQGAANVGPSYVLAPEDVINIYVWREEDLNRSVIVRPDGGISFPLAGEVAAAGKNITELQNEITERIKKYIPGAVVSVSLEKVAGYKIYVVGKVMNPGEYVLGSYVNVMQALTIADGVTPFAKRKDIKVVRGTGESEQIFDFNYDQVERGKNTSQNILLRAGDTVIVP